MGLMKTGLVIMDIVKLAEHCIGLKKENGNANH
jgi:hypothetical protein